MIKYALTFTAGAAVGFVSAYFILKDRTEKIIEEESRSIAEYYENKAEKVFKATEEIDSKKEQLDISSDSLDKLKSKIIENSYAKKEKDYTKFSKKEDKSKPIKNEVDPNYIPPFKNEVDPNYIIPYVITPEQFSAEKRNYDKVTLTYYEEDDTVIDGYDEEVEDSYHILGADFDTKFGEYEDGVVYVRNDNNGTDYEVIKELGCYPGSSKY